MSFNDHVISRLRLTASLNSNSVLVDIGHYPDAQVIPVLNQLMSKGFQLHGWITNDRLRVQWSQAQHGHLVDSEMHTREWLNGIYIRDIQPEYLFRETDLRF